jgi:glycosyltransferase involved in cell wall biosynthesis
MIRAEYFMREPRVAHSSGLIRDPDVSIILPTYCRGDNGLLKRAIDTVLAQSFSSFELIVMDDGSTDGTADLVAAYVKADDRVIHVRHDSNCGLPAIRVNEGLLMARGDLCAYQFDDDLWTNAFLATMVRELRENPGFEVAYGLCRSTYDGFVHMLGGPFSYSQLLAGNYISNNSVVHRRSVFERLGGYDMHLVMRRLCDWDLWLRWGRDAAFLSVHDEIMTIVDGGLSESIGKTVSLDGFLARAQMALDRNASLRPGALKSYAIDDLTHLKHLGEPKVDAAWRQQVAPYQSRFRHIWTAVRSPTTKPLHVLVIKAHFNTTIDITLGNFAEILAGDFAFTFMPQLQTGEAAIRCADILVLHRAFDQHAELLVEIARRQGKPVVLLMDDDLTSYYEVAEKLSYLAPDAPCRVALEPVIRSADLVITYSRLMQESIEELNPCSVMLEVNIRRRWLVDAKVRLNEPASISEAGERPIRIGFAGAGASRGELAVIWPAIVQASRRLGARAEFQFWGFAPDGLEELQSPYQCEPFTRHGAARFEFERALQPPYHCEPSSFSHEQYLGRLASGGFDVMIAPLFTGNRAKLAKCPTKFLEITAAGAVGVYSNVEPYRAVVDGVSGIKCENTVEAWSAAILKAAALPPAERKRLVAQAIQAIERDYTSEGQATRVAATLEAALLHSRLGRSRSGKPRVAYFCHSPYLAGGENNLLRHAMLAQDFQFEPVLVLPSGVCTLAEEIQRRAAARGIAIAYLPLRVETETDGSRQLDESAIAEIQRWLRRNRIALVHSVTLMREVGEAARRLGIPHAASLYATNSCQPAGFNHCDVVHSDSFLYANRWGGVFDAPVRRIMSYVPDRYFDAGDAASAAGPRAGGRPLTIGLFGTSQPRKGQLQAVEAIGLLKEQFGASVELGLYGYDHFYPEYVAACKEMAERYGVSDLVSFRGFVTDHAAAMRSVDAVLCASDWESLPLVILEAMAARRLVIAPNAGGIPEVVSHRTGIPMPDNTAASICRALVKVLGLTDEEWRDRTNLARDVVRAECSKYSVATELFRLYRQAVAECASRSGKPATHAAELAGTVASDAPLSTADLSESLELLRSQLHEINAGLGVAE